MRLQLEDVKQKKLEIDFPNGKKTVTLILKPSTVRELKEREKLVNDLTEKHYKKKIDTVDYLFSMWELSVEKLDRTDFMDLPSEYLHQIGEAMRELQKEQTKKDPEEKKSQ